MQAGPELAVTNCNSAGAPTPPVPLGTKTLGPVARTPDGGAVFAFQTGEHSLAWSRVSETGALDTSVGAAGVSSEIQYSGQVPALGVQADGKVVIVALKTETRSAGS